MLYYCECGCVMMLLLKASIVTMGVVGWGGTIWNHCLLCSSVKGDKLFCAAEKTGSQR